MVYIFIPARAGSKRVPGKNTRSLGGQPLLFYSIDTALACGIEEDFKVLVSTECPNIIKLVSDEYGDKVMVVPRDPALAQDQVQVGEVVINCVRTVQYQHRYCLEDDDIGVILQPTSPFRGRNLVSRSVGLFHNLPIGMRGSIVGVCSTDDGYYWEWSFSEGTIVPLGHDPNNRKGTQLDFENNAVVKEVGSIYVFSIKDMLDRGTHRLSPFIPVLLSKEESIDIDTEDDWTRAMGIA